MRAILHCVDEVFPPLEDGDSPYRQEPTSIKKLNKGDGHPTTQKIILGWLIDFMACTIKLTEQRRARLGEILEQYPRSRKRTSVSEWHKVLGELQSMAVTLPGSRGLFSTLQLAFKKEVTCIRLTTAIHDTLDDFCWILDRLESRPT